MARLKKLPVPPLISMGRKEFFRMIPSRFPPVSIFEQIYETEEDREIAFAIEGMTNPRLRHEAGEIDLIPRGEWLTGPGASPVMAAFTHIGHPSRLTDGTFGIYYAARTLQTAILETSYHRARFLSATKQPDQEVTMRVYSGTTTGEFHDLTGKAFSSLLDPNDYAAPQTFGAQLKEQNSNGLIYPSVRHSGGLCLGAFRPKVLRPPNQRSHLRYVYSATQEAITDVFRITAV